MNVGRDHGTPPVVQGMWGLSFCLVRVISVQYYIFSLEKYRIADEHFVYCNYQLWFLIGMFAESSVQYLCLL